MKAGAGHAKGAAFERAVCKRLSLWLSNGLRDDLLWRAAMSGGRATVQFAAGKVNLAQSGDVSAIGEGAYAFCESTFCEIKHYKDLKIDRGLLCGTGDLANFWRIAVREAHKYGKRPLLIARQNLYPTIAVTRVGDGIFDSEPILLLNHWKAGLHLFDDVTRVKMDRRRSST